MRLLESQDQTIVDLQNITFSLAPPNTHIHTYSYHSDRRSAVTLAYEIMCYEIMSVANSLGYL